MHGMYIVKENKQLYCNNIPRERKNILYEHVWAKSNLLKSGIDEDILMKVSFEELQMQRNNFHQ